MTGLRAVSDTGTKGAVELRDRVRDVMVLTVPRLAKDELEPLVEPDVFMEDDGCAKTFAKAFIFDDTPRMRVRNEVLDLMSLADPLVGMLAAEAPMVDDPEVPADNAEAEWIELLDREAVIPEVPWEVPEEACQAFASLTATTCGFEEQPDWALVASQAVMYADVEDILFGDPDGSFDLPEDCGFVADFEDMGLISLPVPPEPVRQPAMLAAPAVPVAIAAPSAQIRALTVPAPALPAEIPEHLEIEEARTEESVQTSQDAEPVENTPLVLFSFGPQRVPEGGWRVSFSF